jgi:hypothetical protein
VKVPSETISRAVVASAVWSGRASRMTGSSSGASARVTESAHEQPYAHRDAFAAKNPE